MNVPNAHAQPLQDGIAFGYISLADDVYGVAFEDRTILLSIRDDRYVFVDGQAHDELIRHSAVPVQSIPPALDDLLLAKLITFTPSDRSVRTPRDVRGQSDLGGLENSHWRFRPGAVAMCVGIG